VNGFLGMDITMSMVIAWTLHGYFKPGGNIGAKKIKECPQRAPNARIY